MKTRTYAVSVDGEKVDVIELTEAQYTTQRARDDVRRSMAEKHGISVWGLRLVEINRPYIMWTDMQTGITTRKYVSGEIYENGVLKKGGPVHDFTK